MRAFFSSKCANIRVLEEKKNLSEIRPNKNKNTISLQCPLKDYNANAVF